MGRRLLVFLSFLLFFGVILSFKIFAQSNEEFANDALIVRFEEGTTEQEKEAILSSVGAKRERKINRINAQRVRVGKNKVRENVGKLKKNRRVKYAEPDFVAKKTEIPNDTYYSSQWGLPKIKADGGWDKTHGGDSAPVAIADTGINDSHPDLSGKVVKRANFTWDPDSDGDGHGTHVAGIVGATTNNSLGVASLGYDSKLFSVKVLDNNGSGYYSWIASGVIWAADNGAKVINLSLGGTSDSQTLRDAISYAWGKGVVVVAAAGNSNRTRASYPAYYTNAIAVAATDQNDNKASFSNYGSWVDLAAPGVSILSTYENGYAYLSGTSMATPFVSALSSLVFVNNPGFNNQEVRNKIEGSAEKIARTGTYWTYGRIDACAALDCSLGVLEPTPTLTPTPTSTPTPSLTPTLTPSLTPTPTLTPSPSPTPTLPSQSNGLSGVYFNNMDFSGSTFSRIDPGVNFDWGKGSPDSSIDDNTFSARWTGKIAPQLSEIYTFYARTDDGVRVFVNNQLIIDNWNNQSVTEKSGSIQLLAGVKYDIKMEYFENRRNAVAQLSFSSPSTPKQIIPSTVLSP
ncbi:MAG: S8 family serine peptidase [Candidatus Levybacteria bacterium]|nr:S8 family serine peptidase [Candidatus Levybacteria bacterium]